jgi:phosphoglycolate phosphatase-like HAD superfamily hydrolase
VAEKVEIPGNWTWRDGSVAPGPAVVFDIDGVLSDAAGRQHFLEHPVRDWRGFFDAAGEDPLIDDVARLLDLLDPGLVIVLLTGRPLRVRDLTVEWLERHGLLWDLLVMRNRGDYDAAPVFKQDTVTALRARGFDLRLAFEDDRRNVEMFQRAGVPCIYIHSGYYD